MERRALQSLPKLRSAPWGKTTRAAVHSPKSREEAARRRQESLDRSPFVISQPVVAAKPAQPMPSTLKPPGTQRTPALPTARWLPSTVPARSPDLGAAKIQQPQANSLIGSCKSRRQQLLGECKPRKPTKRPGNATWLKIPATYANIELLQNILHGRDSRPAIFIAVDTESEKQGLLTDVVEVGLSALHTKDIQDTAPGPNASTWASLMRHTHVVVDVTRFTQHRMDRSRFGKSRLHQSRTARQAVMDFIAKEVEHSLGANGGVPPSVYLVGHSVGADISQLRLRPLHLDLLDRSVLGTELAGVFDTQALTLKARELGADIPSGKLGQLLRQLGVHSKYLAGGSVAGTHNASNDAAYTMMVLLGFGLRWDELLG